MPDESITSKRCGDVAEMHVASLLLRDPELEVFQTLSDDGHGADLAVWSRRTRRWYAVQVKAATTASNPFVYRHRFRATGDFLVAAVVLDAERRPERTYLIPGEAWARDDSGCLWHNEAGGANGPYFEVRTSAAKHAEALRRYAVEAVIMTL